MQLDILDGKDTHVLMTICQKDGKWQDEDASCSDPHSSKCKTPDFKSLGKDQMGFRKVNHYLMMGDPIYDPDNDRWLTRLKDSLNLLNFQIAFGIISSGIKLLVRQMKTAIRWEMGMVGCHFNSHNAVQLLLSHHRFEEVYLCTVRSRSKFK